MDESLHQEMDRSQRNDPPEAAAQGHSTGDEATDAVLASLAGLDDVAVSDHVAVFEQAHESLRRALADAGQVRAEG